MVAASVAAAFWIMSSAWEREPMLQLTRDVPWGHRIGDTDVTTVDLPPDAREFAVVDVDRGRVVGQIAAGNLRAGQLVALSDVTTQLVPARGQRMIGIRLLPGRYPARGLAPNDPVEVVGLSSTGGAETVQGEAVFQARVVQSSPLDAEGAVVVDLLIDSSAAEQAHAAAAGGALVTLLGPTR
ncbi:SAF domain-containing protein [Saccharopolyspora sp. NPDC002376]